MKILVLSNTAWADDNSFGSTFSNIFAGIPGLEFANIYCRYGVPRNVLVDRYYQITEKSLLDNLRASSVPSGRSFSANETVAAREDEGRTPRADDARPHTLGRVDRFVFDLVRTHRWQLLYWARDMIWKLGRWDSLQFREFIRGFDPDLVFQPIYYSNYLSDMALSIQKYSGAPVVGYVSDDVYTLRQFSLSPLYWIDRFLKRRKVRQVIDACEYLYVISEIQRLEYELCFGKRCEVLTKCADFSEVPHVLLEPQPPDRPLSLVYTGNIGDGRWRTLGLLATELGKLNSKGTIAVLRVYTATPITAAMRKAVQVSGSSELLSAVSATHARELQGEADALVHVEGFDPANRLKVHQSFSTKIVDYLASGRCVLAIGPRDVASIDYLVRNDAALVATDKAAIADLLAAISDNQGLLGEYAQKAWECGRRNHDREETQRRLMEGLHMAIGRRGGTS